jgi:hypothetical protein
LIANSNDRTVAAAVRPCAINQSYAKPSANS